MSNVTGPLDFGSRTYTLLPEAPLAPVGGMALVERGRGSPAGAIHGGVVQRDAVRRCV